MEQFSFDFANYFTSLESFLGPFGFLANADFWQKFYSSTRFAMIILSVVFLAGSIRVLIKIWPLRNRLYVFEGFRAYKAPQQKFVLEEEQKLTMRKKWNEIIKKAEVGGGREYSLAIIEADILIENVLGKMGIRGKNIAERLRGLAPGELSNVDEVWDAHKLRNKIAHEPDFSPSKDETMQALTTYKKGLEELKVI